MYYVYILQLANNENYSGYSSDLKSRIKEHESGRVKATKSYLPIKLIYYCAFRNKLLALNFEKYLKSSSGKAFRKKRLI